LCYQHLCHGSTAMRLHHTNSFKTPLFLNVKLNARQGRRQSPSLFQETTPPLYRHARNVFLEAKDGVRFVVEARHPPCLCLPLVEFRPAGRSRRTCRCFRSPSGGVRNPGAKNESLPSFEKYDSCSNHTTWQGLRSLRGGYGNVGETCTPPRTKLVASYATTPIPRSIMTA
jgi:hypothetical protein